MRALQEIVDATRRRLRDLPSGRPARSDRGARFVDALRGRERLALIAEVKRRSPSRGAIAPAADAVAQARRYAGAGAAAISVLTEPTRFGGSFADLEGVVAGQTRPVLMKDFVLDPEQVRAAALLGASATLVMARLLDDGPLGEVLAACGSYGIAALLECHDEAELARARQHGAEVVGINNRDLGTLEVDRRRATDLAPGAPADAVLVAESGYRRVEDTAPLAGRFDAVLVGTALMEAADPEALIREIVR